MDVLQFDMLLPDVHCQIEFVYITRGNAVNIENDHVHKYNNDFAPVKPFWKPENMSDI